MTKQIEYPDYQDLLEYHGSTVIERTRRRGATTIWRDWLIFNSVEEAEDYFHDR